MIGRQKNNWPPSSHTWLIFFAFTTYILSSLIFFLFLPRLRMASFLAEKEKSNQREIQVLLENEDKDKKKEEKEKVFLSTEENTAQGNLTKEKKFSSKSLDYVLSPGTSRSGEELKQQLARMSDARQLYSSTGDYSVSIIEEKPGTSQKQISAKNVEVKKRIPAYYDFRDKFALSWNRDGSPRIPTKDMKHYQYFRRMLNKIQNNWSPPGGNPFLMSAQRYYGTTPTPGQVRYQPFPSQDIKVVFMLNSAGDVIDLQLHESHGYRSLDLACMDAVRASENFGEVPEELLENERLIIPLIFRIIVNP